MLWGKRCNFEKPSHPHCDEMLCQSDGTAWWQDTVLSWSSFSIKLVFWKPGGLATQLQIFYSQFSLSPHTSHCKLLTPAMETNWSKGNNLFALDSQLLLTYQPTRTTLPLHAVYFRTCSLLKIFISLWAFHTYSFPFNQKTEGLMPASSHQQRAGTSSEVYTSLTRFFSKQVWADDNNWILIHLWYFLMWRIPMFLADVYISHRYISRI